MKILFIGDVVGRPGRRAIERWLPELRGEHDPDVVVANAENSAGGLGATPETLRDLRDLGVDAFTMGNHTWRKRVLLDVIDEMDDIVRPANYADGVPGRGAIVVRTAGGGALGLVEVLGRVYMEPTACPFRAVEAAMARLREKTKVVLVDVHAEATSEKVAMGWFLDGRCTAVVGTHTHVQTADERVLPGGTAYITDVGMTGPRDSVIGTEREPVIDKFLTGLPRSFNVAKGPSMLNGVVIDADEQTGRARSITRVRRSE